MTENKNKRIDVVYNLLALHLICAWGFLLYGIVTTLPILFILGRSSEFSSMFLLPETLSMLGNILAIILIRKARNRIKQRTEFSYCVVAIILSSLLIPMIGTVIGIIALIMFCSKTVRGAFYHIPDEHIPSAFRLGTAIRNIPKRLIIVIGTILALLFFLPTISSLIKGGLSYKTVFTSTSPDGRDTLTISKRHAFPVNEWIDPAIIVRVQLSGERNSGPNFKLNEDSDLILQPKISWTDDAVTIPALSTGRRQLNDLIIYRN